MIGSLRQIVKDKKYRGTIYLPRDERGKRQQKTKVFYGKKREAQRAFSEWSYKAHADHLKNQQAKQLSSPDKMTVSELMEKFLGHCDKRDLKLTTKNSYKYASKHIVRLLGTEVVMNLGLARMENFIFELQKPQKPEGSDNQKKTEVKPLSPGYVRYIFDVFNMAINYAVERSFLPRNVIDSYRKTLSKGALPKQDSKNNETGKPYELEDIKAILESINESILLKTIALTFRDTGLRRGELLGLKLGNIKEDCISVNEQLQKHGNEFVFTTPKTKHGVRVIPLTGELRQALNEWLEYRQKQKLPMHKDSLLFLTDEGKKIDPNLLTKWFRKINRSLGIKVQKPTHAFRHTFLTNVLLATSDFQTTSELGGHHDGTYTAKIYSHTLNGRKKAAVSSYERLLQSQSETQTAASQEICDTPCDTV